MSKQPETNNTKLVNKLLSGAVGKKYQGKQVVVIGGKAFILPEDDHKATNMVEDLEQKYPDQIPHLVFVPRPETYIL